MAEESEQGKGPTPKEWLRISGLVEAALELDRPLRGAWLQSLRRRSPELVDRVTVILADLESGQGGDLQSGDAGAIVVDASRIGAYRLVGLLGRGGMGEVHLAERVDREFEHQVAIKLISAHEDAPLVQQRFLSERQILARLSHPNISRLYEGGTSLDGRPYFVLEYVQGEPIDSYCEQKGLDLDARLALFLEVCGAVEYAHRNLVVHRDLKPANILVDRDGKPKLLDFGIAKLLDPSSMPFALAATLTRQRPMTPAYASPEQIAGLPITTATDVFSLGVVLYRLLTGEMPFEPTGLDELALQQSRARSPLRPSRRLLRTLSKEEAGGAGPLSFFDKKKRMARRIAGDLDDIVAKALRFEPEARYASMAAMIEDLRRYRAGEPVGAARDSLTYRLRSVVRRYRWPLLAVAALFLLSVGWAIALQFQIDATRLERDRARFTRDFLVDLLRRADEEGKGSREVSLKGLLDLGRKNLQGVPSASEREARIDLLTSFARAYSSFADQASAVESYERAIELTGAGESALRTRLLVEKAEAEILSGYTEKAEKSLELAIAEISPSDFVRKAEATSRLAMVAERNLKTVSALEGFRRAAALMGKELANNDAVTFDILRNWVYILDRNNRPQEGSDLAQRAYLYFRPRKGPDSPEAFFFASNLATLEHSLGHAERALAAYRESLRILEATTHPHDPGMALAYNGIGCSLSLMGRLEEALETQDIAFERIRELDKVNPLDQGTRVIEAGILLDRCNIQLVYGTQAGLEHDAQRLLAAAEKMPSTDASPDRALHKGMALAYLGRRDEARLLIARGLEGGWTWSSVIVYLENAGMLPEAVPRVDADFSPPPEIEVLLGPPDQLLPWEAGDEASR